MVWMRTSAFPTFKKLYGRILLEENSKLAYRQASPQQIESNNSFRSILELKNKMEKFFNITEEEEGILYRLPKGQYFIDIGYRYQVTQIYGRKFFILANVSWIGGRCYFMAISYMVVGVLCLVTAAGLIYVHYYYGNM